MKRFIDAIAEAVKDKNWLAAVALSLTMPDVCGGMEQPDHKIEKRYRAWWDKYMLKHSVLSGADAFALRCAYLHEGGSYQRARKALTENHFVVWREGSSPRRRTARKVRNMIATSRGKNVQPRILEVDAFCTQISNAVERWSNDVRANQAVQGRLQSLLEIHELETARPPQ